MSPIRKTSNLIPVQPTAKPRRKTKQSGKTSARYGRKSKTSSLEKQLNVEDEEENVYYKLPGVKSRKKRMVHSLTEAVENNTQNEKRHKH